MTFGDRKKPMARGKGLAPGKGLARGKPLANRSELKRSAPVVRALPAAPKARAKPKATAGDKGAPIPQAMREHVYERDEGRCQRCGVYCLNGWFSIQHRLPKGMGGSIGANHLANLVLHCGSATSPGGCHLRAESAITEAEQLGWRVKRGQDPRVTPCFRFGLRWEQPGELWLPAEPIAA